MPDTTPRASTRLYNTALDLVSQVAPRLAAPFYYKFPMDTDISNRTGKSKSSDAIGGGGGAGAGATGGGVHTVRITAIGGGGGGGGNSGSIAAATKALIAGATGADAGAEAGNSNASASAEASGEALVGAIEAGQASAGGGGASSTAANGIPAATAFATGTAQTLGVMEFIMTNSPENRMSAQWDGTDFGLLGAALESYRKGDTALDALKTIAENPADASEYAVRKLVGMATAVKQLALGGTAPDMISAATRRVENPFREQLFKTMNFRTFPMQFKIAPSSAAESAQLQNALRELERNMHPEKDGLFLIYPSEFKVEFMYDGKKNEFLPTINACILTDMNVQYGHGGFMTSFKNSGGTPTEVTVTLSFKEVFTRDRSHID